MSENLHEISERRLALIRKLISLAYTCPDKELFYKKFKDAVSINSLKDLEIVETSDHVLQILCKNGLSEEEMEMYSLMQQGFTSQEIAVICKEKSVDAVYVKRHRINKKIKGEASPEIVMVMLVSSLVVWIMLRLFYLAEL